MENNDLEKLAQQAENEAKTATREGVLIEKKQHDEEQADQRAAAMQTGAVIVGITFGAIEFLYRDMGLEIPDKEKHSEKGAQAWADVLIMYGITYGDESTYPDWLIKIIAWGKKYAPVLMLIYWNADLYWSMHKLAAIKAEEMARAAAEGGDGGEESKPGTAKPA